MEAGIDVVTDLENKFRKVQRNIPVRRRMEISRNLELIKNNPQFDNLDLIREVELELNKYLTPHVTWKMRFNLIFTHPVFWIILLSALLLEFLLFKFT